MYMKKDDRLKEIINRLKSIDNNDGNHTISDIISAFDKNINPKLFQRKLQSITDQQYLNNIDRDYLLRCYFAIYEENEHSKDNKLERKSKKSELLCLCTLDVSESDKFFNRNMIHINKLDENLYCFGSDVFAPFTIENFEWKGAEYKTEYRTSGSIQTNGRTKRKGRVLGAVVGTAVAPGIGTVIGAMHGTGNSKIYGNSTHSITSKEISREIPSFAYLTVKYLYTQELERFSFLCMSNIAEILLPYKAPSNEDNARKDEISKLKDIKELFDMGVITKEVFEEKKRELLDKI